jgi:hypothetical protein
MTEEIPSGLKEISMVRRIAAFALLLAFTAVFVSAQTLPQG